MMWNHFISNPMAAFFFFFFLFDFVCFGDGGRVMVVVRKHLGPVVQN